MRIEGLISHEIQKNNLNKETTLKSGDIIKGMITAISGNDVTINLSNGNFIKGRTQIPLHDLKGKVVEFLVKEAGESKLILTPLQNNQSGIKQESLFINNILDKFGFIKSQSNIDIVKALLKYKIPLKQETIDKMARSIGKLEDLTNIKTNEKLQVLSNSQSLLGEDIDKIIKVNNNQVNIQDNITNSVKSNLENILSSQKNPSSLINKLAFLIKNEMKVSINNLSFLTDIINNKDFIEDDIKQLITEMGSKGYDIEKVNQHLEKFLQGKLLNFDSTDKENLKESIRNLTKLMEEINTTFKLHEGKEETVFNKSEIINSKLEFLNNINQNSTFYYIPFKIPREDFEKNLFVLNKRRRNKKDDNIKVFISLDTSNIKKIDVLLHKFLDKLNINFTVESEKILKLLQSKEANLKKVLINCGFEDIYLDFNVKNENEVDPLEILSDEDTHNYLLDVRV